MQIAHLKMKNNIFDVSIIKLFVCDFNPLLLSDE